MITVNLSHRRPGQEHSDMRSISKDVQCEAKRSTQVIMSDSKIKDFLFCERPWSFWLEFERQEGEVNFEWPQYKMASAFIYTSNI